MPRAADDDLPSAGGTGSGAAELLLRIIREGNSNIEGKCVLMEPELVIRESCRREDTDMTQDE